MHWDEGEREIKKRKLNDFIYIYCDCGNDCDSRLVNLISCFVQEEKSTNRHKIGCDGESRSFQFILLQIVANGLSILLFPHTLARTNRCMRQRDTNTKDGFDCQSISFHFTIINGSCHQNPGKYLNQQQQKHQMKLNKWSIDEAWQMNRHNFFRAALLLRLPLSDLNSYFSCGFFCTICRPLRT